MLLVSTITIWAINSQTGLSRRIAITVNGLFVGLISVSLIYLMISYNVSLVSWGPMALIESLYIINLLTLHRMQPTDKQELL